METSNHEWLTHVSSSTFTRVMVLEKDNVTLEHRDLSMTFENMPFLEAFHSNLLTNLI